MKELKVTSEDQLGVFTTYSRTFNVNYVSLKVLIYAAQYAGGKLMFNSINYRMLPLMYYIMAEDDLNIAALTGNLDSSLS